MNRLDRLTAILIQLQSKRIVKAQDIASRFEISLRTVYRDIKTLEEGGIPILGEAGIGYSIMDGYRLPPIMFTKEEASAFLTAEKFIEKLTDTDTETSYKSAMYKIKAVLRSSEKDFIETIDKSITVVNNPYLPKTTANNIPIQQLLNNISEKKVLSINYFANHSQENTQRNIEPVGIFYSGNYWHLIAFCQLRNDYRDFRIDRISRIIETQETITKLHPDLKTFLNQLSKEKDLTTIIMKVDPRTAKNLGDQKYYNGFVSQQMINDKMVMTFLTCSMEGFARWYMMFGDSAEIISPISLKSRIKNIAEIILKK